VKKKLMLRALIVLLTFAASLTLTEIGQADVTAAAKAFSEGQQAQVSGDFALAAEKFELAHSILPSAAALRSAARMRMKAGHLATAATHADGLLLVYADDEASVEAAQEILKEAGPQLAHFDVKCSQQCTVSIDGKAIGGEKRRTHAFYGRPGSRTVQVWFGPTIQSEKSVEVEAGETLELAFDAPAAEAAPPAATPRPADQNFQKSDAGKQASTPLAGRRSTPAPSTSRGVHAAWFSAGLALTVGAGAATAWSGMETRDLRERFDAEPTRETYDEGRSAQLRTNIFAAVTAAAGITTLILSMVTDWGEPTAEKPVAIMPTGIHGRF
jgi:hypothetical protein